MFNASIASLVSRVRPAEQDRMEPITYGWEAHLSITRRPERHGSSPR